MAFWRSFSIVRASFTYLLLDTVIKAGESKPIEVVEADIVITVSNLALNNGADNKATKVWATVEDEDGPQKVLLAVLRAPATEQLSIDLTFPQDVTLSVEGSGEVHFTGIVAPADDGEDDEAMYGGFPSDEEDEDEDGLAEGSGSDEEGDEDGSEDFDQDPRVEELSGSDEEAPAKPAKGNALKLLHKADRKPAAAPAKSQRIEIPINDNKKPAAAPAKPKAAKAPAAAAAEGGVANLSCTVCSKAFNNPTGLEQHMKAKHGAGGDAKPAAAAAATTPKPATPKAAPKAAAAPATPKAATPKAGTPKQAKK